MVIDAYALDDPALDRLGRQLGELPVMLARSGLGLPDLRVGAVSADMGDGGHGLPGCTATGHDGTLVPVSACGLTDSLPFLWLRGVGYEVLTNAPDAASSSTSAPESCVSGVSDGTVDLCDVSEALGCVVAQTRTTCEIAQPLAAMGRAITMQLSSEAGDAAEEPFLRGVAIWFVVVAPRDDCTAANPALFDPAGEAELGPLSPYRCFEFGARCGNLCYSAACDGPIPREPDLELRGCRPLAGTRDEPSAWLAPVSTFAAELAAVPAPMIVDVIGGRYDAASDAISTVVSKDGSVAVAPACEGPAGVAAPAIRVAALLDAVAPGSPAIDFCAPSYSDLVSGNLITGDLMPCRLCAPGGGVGAAVSECSVEFVQEDLNGSRLWSMDVPNCDFGASGWGSACSSTGTPPTGVASAPCWYACLEGSPAECGADTQWELRFCHDRRCDPTAYRPSNTKALVACRE